MYSALWIVLAYLSTIWCNDDWDYLIFSQRWPVTACAEWEEASKSNKCTFPNNSLWLIHGVWPTKVGTKGPWNCNSTWHFDDNIINPIKIELEQYWTNIESNSKLDSFWKHEWEKHGTCAATLPLLDNELKYFQQGLTWIQGYDVKDVLSQKLITPRPEGYSVQEVFDCVQLHFTKAPIVQCVIDKSTKQSLISEIRLCFNRDLELVDCHAVKDFGDFELVEGILTNCDVKKAMVYPDSIQPYVTTTAGPTTIKASNFDILVNTRRTLLDFYKFVKLVIWFSL